MWGCPFALVAASSNPPPQSFVYSILPAAEGQGGTHPAVQTVPRDVGLVELANDDLAGVENHVSVDG